MSIDVAPQAGNYEEYWERLRDSARYHPANRFRYALIANRVRRRLIAGSRVLDVGCGDARLLRFLRSLSPKSSYYGCDISQHVIDLNAGSEANIHFFRADSTSDDFKQSAGAAGCDQFDVIVSSEVIEHVEDDAALLKNVALCLKPSGYFVLTTQSGRRYRVDRELLHHLRHYDRGHLEEMIRQAGLEVIESYNCGFPVLTAQKIIANALFEAVMRTTASSTKPPFIIRRIMDLMYVLMRMSPKWMGPQLVLVARRPE